MKLTYVKLQNIMRYLSTVIRTRLFYEHTASFKRARRINLYSTFVILEEVFKSRLGHDLIVLGFFCNTTTINFTN